VRLSLGRLGGEPDGEHGLAAAASLADEGHFRVPVERLWPTSEAALAHQAVEKGSRRGKVVIAPDW
jgi:NADPH:quinone reductase-like Zn-dependent oxidoreductase